MDCVAVCRRLWSLTCCKIYLVGTLKVSAGGTYAKYHFGLTPLHQACRYGHLIIEQYGIEYCGVDSEETNDEGRTVLHIASANGNLSIVRYLRETFHVDAEAKNNDGTTWAQKFHRTDSIQFFNDVPSNAAATYEW